MSELETSDTKKKGEETLGWTHEVSRTVQDQKLPIKSSKWSATWRQLLTTGSGAGPNSLFYCLWQITKKWAGTDIPLGNFFSSSGSSGSFKMTNPGDSFINLQSLTSYQNSPVGANVQTQVGAQRRWCDRSPVAFSGANISVQVPKPPLFLITGITFNLGMLQ